MSVGRALRPQPLPPIAALALEASSFALAARLLELSDAHLQRLRGVAGRELLLVLGNAEDLPWCDGLTYLGREPTAPGLLLPCAETVDVAASLFLDALLSKHAARSLQPPLAVSFEPKLVLSVVAARQLDRDAILAWQVRGAPP